MKLESIYYGGKTPPDTVSWTKEFSFTCFTVLHLEIQRFVRHVRKVSCVKSSEALANQGIKHHWCPNLRGLTCQWGFRYLSHIKKVFSAFRRWKSPPRNSQKVDSGRGPPWWAQATWKVAVTEQAGRAWHFAQKKEQRSGRTACFSVINKKGSNKADFAPACMRGLKKCNAFFSVGIEQTKNIIK